MVLLAGWIIKWGDILTRKKSNLILCAREHRMHESQRPLCCERSWDRKGKWGVETVLSEGWVNTPWLQVVAGRACVQWLKFALSFRYIRKKIISDNLLFWTRLLIQSLLDRWRERTEVSLDNTGSQLPLAHNNPYVTEAHWGGSSAVDQMRFEWWGFFVCFLKQTITRYIEQDFLLQSNCTRHWFFLKLPFYTPKSFLNISVYKILTQY